MAHSTRDSAVVDATAHEALHPSPSQPSHVMLLSVFAALMVLLVLTVVAGCFDLGVFHLPVAMSISVAKMALIVWYFMNLRASGSLTRLAAGLGFFWLAIMFLLTFADFIARGSTALNP
jgi:cytochrome c oxidase subunit 4